MHEGFVEFYGPTPARTVDEYLARIDRQWLRDAEERAPDERAAFLVKLDADERALRAAEGWGPLMSLRKLQTRVLGLDVQTVDVRGALTLTAARLTNDDEPPDPALVELAAEVVERERARLAPPVAANGVADAANC